MAIVAHKYITEAMPEAEFLATFAARQHTVDYLVEELRRQIPSATLSSFLLTGPRGAGKSTLLRMLRLRIRDDAALSNAWLPVLFSEEQFNVASLRDLFAEALRTLAENGTCGAAGWLEKVEAERNDEQSEELAIAGLKEVARLENKRLILFIENLDEFFDHAATDRMKGTLRRLLMTDPFMLIVGSAVHMFESLRQYDEAFFNYFVRVPLGRLTEAEVFEVLTKRAQFDGNATFLQQLPGQRAHIAAIAHLSGGNPRLIMLLYELLSQKQVTTIVQQLRRLVDELTPLLKHELENLPAQQQKIIHALMEQGGTATPSALTGSTRLSLNSVTQQLRRLKEMQVLDMHGGGKGRAAYYTVPDKLFSIWYQMRYLSSRRRHIEMFVEVLRVWFEAEERLKVLSDVCTTTPHRGAALTAEYYAASLTGTPYEDQARDLALRQWLRAQDVREAALAHAEFARLSATDESARVILAHADLGEWFLKHKNADAAVQVLEPIAKQSNDPEVLKQFGWALVHAGNYSRAENSFDRLMAIAPVASVLHFIGLFGRGFARERNGNLAGAAADFTMVLEHPQLPINLMYAAHLTRGMIRYSQGKLLDAITDYSAVLGSTRAPVEALIPALMGRGLMRHLVGDFPNAVADYTRVVEVPAATNAQIADALSMRGVAYEQHGQTEAALKDWQQVLTLEGAPSTAIVTSAGAAYSLASRTEDDTAVGVVLMSFVGVLSQMEVTDRGNLLVNWLATLAVPVMKPHWARACRIVLTNQPAEVTEALRAFIGVADVLESGDRAGLDAFPPEQRGFALKILERFENPTESP